MQEEGMVKNMTLKNFFRLNHSVSYHIIPLHTILYHILLIFLIYVVTVVLRVSRLQVLLRHLQAQLIQSIN